MDITLNIWKRQTEGDFQHTYAPLLNLIDDQATGATKNQIKDFTVARSKFPIDINNTINVECQPSYDGSVNLIINDDTNPPRIINSRFTQIENNRFRVINRNQLEQTNLYKESKVDQQTRLFRNLNTISKIDLINVAGAGQLKGGNYTFYIKFSDNDYNKTDIVAESGQVCIFKGSASSIPSISGTLSDELTDKSITLKISNVDTSFSKIYIYYTRETSDTNGVRISKAYEIVKPYDISNPIEYITINGYEEINEITTDDLNIKYNLVTAVKTQAQVQNMLFFGNVQTTNIQVNELQTISHFIKVTLKQDTSIGYVSPKDYTGTEYYDPLNIYYRLGYWPDEIYRLGIVYIMSDDSLSNVFNLRGCEFSGIDSDNGADDSNLYRTDSSGKTELNPDPVRDAFINSYGTENTFGVFKNPNVTVISSADVKPLYYSISIGNKVSTELSNRGVKGFFIVRQKRIPTTICQGYSVGIDSISYTPVPKCKPGKSTSAGYIGESFLTDSGQLSSNDITAHLRNTNTIQCSALLSVDAMVTPTIQSTLDGGSFEVRKETNNSPDAIRSGRYIYSENTWSTTEKPQSRNLIYINGGTQSKFANNYNYATRCGVAEDVSQLVFFGTKEGYNKEDYTNFLRGEFCPIIGVDTTLAPAEIYTIKISNYSSIATRDLFNIRHTDNSSYYAITDRYALEATTVDAFRGDCYSNTVTVRLNRNFVDAEVPICDTIVDPSTWSDNYKGYNKMRNVELEEDDSSHGTFLNMNRADINAVPLGLWITYKCLSSSNLGLRAIDRSHTDETALMGNPRSFYPLYGMSTKSNQKIDETQILNMGYCATVGVRSNFIVENVPYIKDIFDNRLMFSNVQEEDAFKNSYRIFQGLSYKDIDNQYGAIVKVIPWEGNLFCVFEHGIGIVPVNQKALMQTTTGQSVHLYGAEVLQKQVSVISPDFGSIWADSIIQTPIGIYGVDTYAKKIWRYSAQKGFETISDMKIQQFLNKNIRLSEMDKYTITGTRNVKTHFNNYKGDVMFTFYNENKRTSWSICFNERMDKWITRYSWIPLCSANVNNIFYSCNQAQAKLLAQLYVNKFGSERMHTTQNPLSTNNYWTNTNDLTQNLYFTDYTLASKLKIKTGSISATTSVYVDGIVYDLELDGSIFTSGEEWYIRDDNTCTGWLKCTWTAFLTELKRVLKKNNLSEDIIPAFISVRFEVQQGIKVSGQTDLKWSDSLDDYYTVLLLFIAPSSKQQEYFLQNGIYVHGKAGIFDEIDYEDDDPDNECKPTFWYDKQEPFEFEFVVNSELGMHKIFNNLVIISNNVQPNQIEYSIEGDVFMFNKAGIYRSKTFGENVWTKCKSRKQKQPWGSETEVQSTQDLINCEVKWDTTLNNYWLTETQDCKNIYDYGRRLGNIQYKEDSWYITIDPIYYKEKYRYKKKDDTEWGNESEWSSKKEARLRDKYMKVRVRYTGTETVVITALKTLLTLSYS